MNRLLSLFTCAALVAAPLTARANELRFDVDVSELDGDNDRLRRFVLETLTPELEAEGWTLTGDAPTQLRVRFRALEDGDRNYGIHFEFVDEGGEATSAIDWVDCIFCSQYRLEQKLGEATPKLVAALEERRDLAEAVDDAEDGGAEDGVDGSGDGHTEDGGATHDGGSPEPQRKLGALAITGIVGLGVGAGLAVGGAVEVSRGTATTTGDNFDAQVIDHRTPGIALLVSGGAVLVAGAIMLGVGLAKRKNGPQRKSAVQAHGLGIRF